MWFLETEGATEANSTRPTTILGLNLVALVEMEGFPSHVSDICRQLYFIISFHRQKDSFRPICQFRNLGGRETKSMNEFDYAKWHVPLDEEEYYFYHMKGQYYR